MNERMNYGTVAPEGIRALGGLETYVRGSGLEPGLLDLVKARASQLNGCAYCIDMHTKDARAEAKPSSDSTPCPSGARPRSTPIGSGPRSPGPRR